MKGKLRVRILVLSTAAMVVFAAAACSGSGDRPQNDRSSVSNSQPANTASPRVNSNYGSPLRPTPDDPSTTPGFSTATVCSLPREVAKDSPFAALGGGTWERWDDEGGELSFSCTGGKESIKLEDVIAKISASYSALGDENSVRAVTATYIALQYGGEVPVEDELRVKYVDLCDGLSRKFFGQPLPANLRKRLSDESKASATGAAGEIKEKVGEGLISLQTRREKTDMVRHEVNFFPDEAAYTKFNER